LVAFSQLHVSTELFKSLVSELVSGVDHPSVGLHEHSWSQVVLWMPPVGWASGLAASAEHALVKTIQKLSLLSGLQVLFLSLGLLSLSHQVWVNLFVLRVEVRHVNDQVLQDEHEHKGTHGGWVYISLWHWGQAGQVMSSVDVHGAGSANTFSAASSERQSWVNLILNLDKGIQEHGAAFLHVNIIRNVVRLVSWLIWVGSINVKPLHISFLLVCETLIELNSE